MSGKALEIGIVITADGKIAVTEANKVERQLQQLGAEGKKAGADMAAGSAQAGAAANTLATQIGQAAQKQEQYVMSAKAMSSALRGVPAQFTDIATSLAAGQNPLQVFLQQGGQLKDMFGGIGPAARALGGYVAGLVSPVTVAGAAIVGLAVAAEMGRRESEGMARAIIMSGNAAGTTVGQMQAYSRTVADATGATRGAAADALTQLTATGKVGSEMLGRAADTAVRLQRVGGPAIDDTVSRFAELGKSPVEASLKLNEQTNYLTTSVYLQIKALQEQNDTAGAAATAQEAYAAAGKKMATDLEANLGLLERAWRGVAGGAKWAWDSMLDIGRKKSTEDQITALTDELVRAGKSGNNVRAIALAAEIGVLRQQLGLEKEKATAASATKDEFEKQRKAIAEADKSATHQIATLKASLDLVKAAPDTADRARRELEITRQIRDLSFSLGKEERDLANARTDGALKLADVRAKGDSAHLAALRQMGQVGDSQALNEQADRDYRLLQAQRAAAAARQAGPSPADQAKHAAELEAIDAQLIAARQERLDQFDLMEDKAGRDAIARDAAIAKERGQAERAFTLDYIAKNQQALREASVAGDAALIAQLQAQFDSGLGNARFTAVKQEYDLLFEQLKVKLEAVRQEAEKDGGWLAGINAAAKSDEIKSQLMPQLDALGKQLDTLAGKNPVNLKTAEAAKGELQKVAHEIAPIWKKTVEGVDKTFHDAFRKMLDTGKVSWKDFAESLKTTFKTTVADAIYQMFARPFVFQAVASVAGTMGVSGAANAFGAAGGAGGAGNLLSAGSSLSNLGGISAGYGALATSSIGQGLGLSTATAAGYSAPVFASAAEGGALLSAGSGTAAGGLTAAGSTIGAAIPYVGLAIAALAMMGAFDGGGEDPHNNAQISGFELGLNKSGVFAVQNADATGAPSMLSAGPTSGDGWWADSVNLSADQLAAINQAVAATFAQGHKLATMFGVDPARVDAASVNSLANGTPGNGRVGGYFSTMEQAFAALSDQITRVVWPDVTRYQEAGKSLTQTLTDNISALDAFNASLASLHKQFTDFNNQLDLGANSTLDPLSKYRAAKGIYDTAVTGTDSAAAISAAKDFLQISRDVFGSTTTYASDYGAVKDALAVLESSIAATASAGLPASLKALQAALPSHASGLSVVPYDGYMATLHRDEAVVDAGAMAVLRRYGISAGGDNSKLEEHMAASVRVSAAGLQTLIEEIRALRASVAGIESTARLAALAA